MTHGLHGGQNYWLLGNIYFKLSTIRNYVCVHCVNHKSSVSDYIECGMRRD